MRVVITGGAGFIGANFVHWWVERHPGDEVVVVDALTYAGVRESLASVESRITFVHADVGDTDRMTSLFAERDVDLVVHFAAESHNSYSVLDPGRFVQANVVATQRLLDVSRKVGVGRFHHISTDEVFGDLALDAVDTFTEETPYRPRTPYAASKAGADHIVRAYHETFGLPVTITNCANNYGPYQFPEKVLPLFATRALDDQPLPMYASTQNRREWLHVTDHSAAIELVATNGTVGETYMVGSGVEKSIEEIADIVLAALDKPASLKSIVPDRPGHDRRYFVDSTKLRTDLSWAPTIDATEGLYAAVRWYGENRAWWEPLRGRTPVDEGTAWNT